MAENKTKPTGVSVGDFIDRVEPERRRCDARALIEIMTRLSGEAPAMWGPSIVGFGTHHYRYASGREGDICRIGFSPRKAKMVLYLSCDLDRHAALLERLGSHSRGVGCLYINRLDAVDGDALEALIQAALAAR